MVPVGDAVTVPGADGELELLAPIDSELVGVAEKEVDPVEVGDVETLAVGVLVPVNVLVSVSEPVPDPDGVTVIEMVEEALTVDVPLGVELGLTPRERELVGDFVRDGVGFDVAGADCEGVDVGEAEREAVIEAVGVPDLDGVPEAVLVADMEILSEPEGVMEGDTPAVRDAVSDPDSELELVPEDDVVVVPDTVGVREDELVGVTDDVPDAVPVGEPVPEGVGDVEASNDADVDGVAKRESVEEGDIVGDGVCDDDDDIDIVLVDDGDDVGDGVCDNEFVAEADGVAVVERDDDRDGVPVFEGVSDGLEPIERELLDVGVCELLPV
jgi:hypothetical protein